MALIGKAIPLVQEKYKALVVYNEGSNFSAGANLGLPCSLNIAAWGEIEKLVAGGQEAYKALKYAPFPVVSAPSGMALGGGCEILLNSDAVQAACRKLYRPRRMWGGPDPRLGWLRRDARSLAAESRFAQGAMPVARFSKPFRQRLANPRPKQKNMASCDPATASR
jgi:hypothetical protein